MIYYLQQINKKDILWKNIYTKVNNDIKSIFILVNI